MIGQDYFDLRSRVGSALLALREFSADSAPSDDQAATIDSLIGGLKGPFLFVVVGEVNVGKSTFLDALFGADLPEKGATPDPEKSCFFKHGPELRRAPVTRTLEEVHAPVDFLRDFNLVDTPGANSIESENREITGRFVPMADLVILVFSAMNPWGGSSWQFLEKVRNHPLRNLILVLQQSDLREPEEIQSILAYMKQLCAQRFGREVPIFPVSAKRACLARNSGLDHDRLFAASGFNSLERHISGVIGGSSAHLGKLAGSLEAARQILGSLRSGLESRARRRREIAGNLRAIDEEIAARAQRTFDKVSQVSEAAVTGLQESAQGAVASVAGRFIARDALRSVFRERRSFSGVEKPVQDELSGEDQERWNRAAAILEDDVCATADQLRGQLASGLNVQTGGELRPDAAFWEAQRGRLVRQVGDIQRRVSSSLEVSKRLAPALRSSRRVALWQVMSAAAGGIAAIALGAAGWWISAAGAAVAGSLAFFLLGRMNSRVLARAFAHFESDLSAAPMEMKNLLDQRFRDETENLYESFNRVLEPVREELRAQERRHLLSQGRVENLARTFDGLGAELAPGATRPD